MSELNKDPFTSCEYITCRDGITRGIYPAKLKHKDKLRQLTPMFNDLAIVDNIFDFNKDKNSGVEYTDNAWNAMMEVLKLAFDEKYSKEEIEDFLDLALTRKVFEIFYDISSLKKNNLIPTME